MNLLRDNKPDIIYIISSIEWKLRDRETFHRVCTYDHGGIAEIIGFLTEVPGYAYVKMEITEDDLKDLDKVVDDFVREWCANDNPEDVRLFKRFIEDGNRWGWD